MTDLKERSFVVFVLDRNGAAITNARVEVLIAGHAVAGGTTVGDPTRPIRVHLSEDVQVVDLRAIVNGITKQVTVDVSVGSITLQFEEVEVPTTSKVPDWFPKAGLAIALLAIVFFMALVILSIFGKLPPPEARFLVVMTISLCAAFAFTFLGADAIAKGRVPLPFVKESPIVFSAGGGVAVFVIVFTLVSWIYPEGRAPTS